MSSDSESGANGTASERETQFVYQPGDEDLLWTVDEITGERGKMYKVKWSGVDPATGKPWPQSWVAKHDCTDDLVVDWKRKKRLAAGKKRGVGAGRRTSTASRTSGTSGRVGSSTTSGTVTRRSTSKATSSRVDLVEQDADDSSPPKPKPKPSTTKRKRQSETPAISSNSAVQIDEKSESSRPRKKQKTIVEVVAPSIHKGSLENKVPRKSNGDSRDVSDGDGSLPPKTTDRQSSSSSKGAIVDARVSDVRASSSSIEIRAVPQRKKRFANTTIVSDVSEDEDEALRPPRSRKKSIPKHKPPSEQRDDISEKEAESTTHPIKIGPPRGVKRQQMSKKSEQTSKAGPSRTKPQENNFTDERVSAEDSGDQASPFGIPLLLRGKTVADRTSSPQHICIPQVPLSTRHRSPDLSPGAKARLDLFDRMMANPLRSDVSPAPEHAADNFDVNETHNTPDDLDTFDPPPLSSLQSKPGFKPPKPGTPNGLIIPETESSGISQSQLQPSLQPPPPSSRPPLTRDQSPRKPVDLPTIAVIVASAASSSASTQDLVPPQKPLFSLNRPSKIPTFMTGPRAPRSTTNARARVTDPEPPMSSIESFTSPGRVNKGKQRALENDQFQSSLSEGEGDDWRQKRRTHKTTDSELKRRGKELFDQAQLAREAEWQKNQNPKRLKAVDEIVNKMGSSSSKGSPLPFTSGAESALELRLEDAVDLSGGANSITLDTQEHSGTKPLSEEERERLRIELRQEEEENTQEAMGIYPQPPVKESEVILSQDSQMPPPMSSKNPSLSEHVEDIDHVEQPSTDLVQASVIVQASQDQRHEDTDIDPLPVNQLISSPPCPVPENLTDSPKRKLGEALSLLNVKSEEIQRLERELVNERNNIQGLKAELAELRQSSEPTGPVRAAWEAERAQWVQERTKWEKDFATRETQRKEMSEERENLSARLVELSDADQRAKEASAKVAELEAGRVTWTTERSGMLNDMVQRSEEIAVLAKARDEYDQDRLDWEAERTLWTKEKARWEIDRATLQERHEALLRCLDELTTSADSIKAARASAEKDRDFFHEQYMQASAFVSSIRDENVELEKRVKIAEGQAQEGVAAIKALFEGRVKALQADVDRWKGLTELLQEKDRRTNDELRLRASQTPELVELCGHLSTENKSLEADVRKLGQAQQRNVHQRNRLFYQILLLKKERASLRSKLSKLTKTVESGTSTQEIPPFVPAPPILDPESIDPNDMETLPDPTPQSLDTTSDEPALFPCMWRPQWRDQCPQTFDTKEDLERHMQEHFCDLLAQ